MKYMAAAETDIGIYRATNQDSLMIKQAQTIYGEVLMAVICDGMGGLSKGELASATVVRAFESWFENEFPDELENLDMNTVSEKWSSMLKDLNIEIALYGQKYGIKMGTTFTGMLMAKDRYFIVHVGDTRVYQIDTNVTQLTKDHTYVAREIDKGTITELEAETHEKRNTLLQCIGASKTIDPQIISGNIEKCVYMLCSDGFRHEISNAEFLNNLNPDLQIGKERMHLNLRKLIDENKKRNERDNISAILIRAL